MQHFRNDPSGQPLRRLVLGAALAIGLAVALLPDPSKVRAADLPAIAQATAPADKKAKNSATPEAAPEAPAAPAPPKAATPKQGADADSEDDDEDSGDDKNVAHRSEIIIEKGDKHVRIQGFGRDREFDSFDQFVEQAPWLAGLVFLTVMLVFLVPLLIIVLLIWYKLRKNRLANETMLKLAERGAVTPSAAMDAVASGTAASMAAAAATASTAAPTDVPAYERARLLNRRVAWSDLRKGVVMTAVGLGLCAYSMFNSGSANSIGLVVLFLGLGYCLLWYFEDRREPPRSGSQNPPPAGSV